MRYPWGDRDQLQNQIRNWGLMQLLVSKARRAGVLVWEAKHKLLEGLYFPHLSGSRHILGANLCFSGHDLGEDHERGIGVASLREGLDRILHRMHMLLCKPDVRCNSIRGDRKGVRSWHYMESTIALVGRTVLCFYPVC